jgi:hypothetical protein
MDLSKIYSIWLYKYSLEIHIHIYIFLYIYIKEDFTIDSIIYLKAVKGDP